MEYETFQRSNDWVAHIKGHNELWECGATEEEAVEKLRATRGNLTQRAADGAGTPWTCSCGYQNFGFRYLCGGCNQPRR